MNADAGDRDKGENGRFAPESPACAEVRREIILGVFREQEGASLSAAEHLASCPSCRSWEAEVRLMHGLCQGECGSDPAVLTEHVIEVAAAPQATERLAAAVPRLRSLVGVVAVSIVLANLILAAFLPAGARVFLPIAIAAIMLAVTFWVYTDSRGRDIRRGFWMSIQPFTLPAGLIAYFLCRRRSASRCPECGAQASSKDLFCSSCGRKLQELCCRCSRPVRREFHVCPWCGTPLTECRLEEEVQGSPCGWSRGMIAFVLVANAALLAAFIAALFSFASGVEAATASIYVLGVIPLFNWTAVDSRRRAMDTVRWGLLSFIAGYVGLVIYLACRSELVVECPVCGSYPPASFNYCPCCGSLIGPTCSVCGTATGDGSYCAVCGTRRA